MDITCPKCHLENPAESKSCMHCGLLLDVVDKIPTFHPETKDSPAETHSDKETQMIPPEDEQKGKEKAVETAEEQPSESPSTKSSFSKLKGLFKKKKT